MISTILIIIFGLTFLIAILTTNYVLTTTSSPPGILGIFLIPWIICILTGIACLITWLLSLIVNWWAFSVIFLWLLVIILCFIGLIRWKI